MEKKLNILFLASWYPNRFAPTQGNFIQNHAKAISKYANIYVFHFRPSEEIGSKIELEISEEENLKEYVFYTKTFKGPGAKFRKWKYYKTELLKVLDKEKVEIDLIHSNVMLPVGVLGKSLARLFKVPHVLTEHSSEFRKGNQNAIPFYRKVLMRSLGKSLDLIIPVSEQLSHDMLAMNIGKPEIHMVLPNVVDIKHFYHDSNTPKVYDLLHVSNLKTGVKNVKGILDAIALLKGAGLAKRLHIISDKDYSHFERLANEMGLSDQVTFQGRSTPDQIADAMRSSKMFVLFSNYENLPCVISEAHCCGVPVISSDVGGIPEMIDESNGILIKPGDVHKLSAAIKGFTEMTFDSSTISTNAAAKYSNEVVAESYLAVYRSVL